MNQMFRLLLLCGCLKVCAGQAQEGDLSKLTEPDRKQVNEWMSQRAEVLVDAHRIERDVQHAWADTAYTSPELDALRARYRELQQALLRTQEELQKKVQEVPAVQAKMRQLADAKEKALALSKKISDKTGK
jgi:uncharacterized protein (DUF3084 family)